MNAPVVTFLGPEGWRRMLLARLPRGPAWPRRPTTLAARVLMVWAQALGRIEAQVQTFDTELDPRSTLALLPEWERMLGLPDACAPAGAMLAERRVAAHTAYTWIGDQSPHFFRRIAAAALGYAIDILEFRPAVCGRARCGHRLNGTAEVRFVWRVRVRGARVLQAHCGASRCGDRLTALRRAADLECLFRRYAPAHTQLIFAYQGA